MTADFEKATIREGYGFTPPAPNLEFLYRIMVDVSDPIDVGSVDKGLLKIIPITGGRFEGPKLKGEVLAAGADWNTTSNLNGTTKHVDTRYILKTDDGAVISLFTEGYITQSEETMKRRMAKEPVDPANYYFKQHLFFETSSEKYSWLNYVVALGCVISRVTPGVIYDAWILR